MKRQLFALAMILGFAMCGSAIAGPGTIVKAPKEKSIPFNPFVVTIGNREALIAIRDNGNNVLATRKFSVIQNYQSHEIVSKKFKAEDEEVLYKIQVRQKNKEGQEKVNYFLLDIVEKQIHDTRKPS